MTTKELPGGGNRVVSGGRELLKGPSGFYQVDGVSPISPYTELWNNYGLQNYLYVEALYE